MLQNREHVRSVRYWCILDLLKAILICLKTFEHFDANYLATAFYLLPSIFILIYLLVKNKISTKFNMEGIDDGHRHYRNISNAWLPWLYIKAH